MSKENGILVHCHTNLDDFRTVGWPTHLCCRPHIGDHIQSKCGRELQITKITHSLKTPYFDKTITEPYLIIYLDKPNWQKLLEQKHET